MFELLFFRRLVGEIHRRLSQNLTGLTRSVVALHQFLQRVIRRQAQDIDAALGSYEGLAELRSENGNDEGYTDSANDDDGNDGDDLNSHHWKNSTHEAEAALQNETEMDARASGSVASDAENRNDAGFTDSESDDNDDNDDDDGDGDVDGADMNAGMSAHKAENDLETHSENDASAKSSETRLRKNVFRWKRRFSKLSNISHLAQRKRNDIPNGSTVFVILG
jgi:hypothetical protein